MTKWPQGYIQGRAKHIARSLTTNHEVVKCLMAFRENALEYAAEVLATIEWGTQHWKLQESFPVPLVPRWLHMPELILTTMPLRGELPLIPQVPTLKTSAYAALHCGRGWPFSCSTGRTMTGHLYQGHFRQASELAGTLIRDINPWLPHRVCFGVKLHGHPCHFMAGHARPICQRTPHRMGSPEVPDALSQ